MTTRKHVVAFGAASIDVLDPALDGAQPGDNYVAVLREYASDTYERCTYHRQRLKQTGVDPTAIRSLADFRQIPLLGPADVSAAGGMRLLPDVYAEAARSGRLGTFPREDTIAKMFQTTSTSGGYPKASYYTTRDWDANCAMFSRQHRDLPIEKFSRTFNCYHPGHYAGNTIHDSMLRHGVLVENQHFTFSAVEDVVRQLETHLQSIGGFNAIALPAPVERRVPRPGSTEPPRKGMTLHQLLDADLNNFIGERVRVVFCGGSANPPELRLRERLHEANDLAGTPPTILIERYGCSETGVIAAQCPAGGMHLSQGFVYTEIIDEKTNTPVANGQRGLVVVTGLHHGSRYLRYILGDEATYLSDPCACGRASPRIADVRRVIEVQRLQGGCAAGGI